jgi:hypothetical protein
MKTEIVLLLAFALSGGLFGCSTTDGNVRLAVPVRYQDSRYDLTFALPSGWQGYEVLKQQWEGQTYLAAMDKTTVPEQGPVIVLRHPQWTAGNPSQDIPILVFTRGQWDSLHHGNFTIYAGGVVYELWHNQKYVFGIHSRYNADDSATGWREAQDVVERNSKIHDTPHLYPE